MPKLASEHDNLSAVMAFVGDEIAQNVGNVEREVARDVRLRIGNRASVVAAEFEQAEDALATQLQCRNEVVRRHFEPVDATWHGDAMFFAEGLDPHTAGVVNMSGNHPDGAARRSGYGGVPEFGRQMLDEKNGDPIVGLPRIESRVSQVWWRR